MVSVHKLTSHWRLGLVCIAAVAVGTLSARAFFRSGARAQAGSQRTPSEAKALAAASPTKPYFAQYEERVENPAKHLAYVSARMMEGVRADGSKVTRNEFFGTNGHMFTERRLYLADSVLVDITDDTKAVVAQRIGLWSPRSVTRLDPATDCQRDFLGRQRFEKFGPDDVVEGLRAVKVQRSGLTKGSTSQWQFWYLPDESCVLAKQVVTFSDANGKQTDGSERVLLSLTRAEPPADLFSLPTSYDQVSPSEAIRRRATLLGNEITPAQNSHLQALDVEYFRHKVDLSEIH